MVGTLHYRAGDASAVGTCASGAVQDVPIADPGGAPGAPCRQNGSGLAGRFATVPAHLGPVRSLLRHPDPSTATNPALELASEPAPDPNRDDDRCRRAVRPEWRRPTRRLWTYATAPMNELLTSAGYLAIGFAIVLLTAAGA